MKRDIMQQVNYIDLGAHEGQEIQVVLKDYESVQDDIKLNVYGVEANPNLYRKLTKLEECDNVKIYNYAISDTNDDVKLYISKGANKYGSSIYKTKRNVDANNYSLVQGMKMTDFIKTNVANYKESINVLKLNIEGAELLVYEDLIKNDMMRYIHMFCGHPRHDIEKVKELSNKVDHYYNIIKNNNIELRYLCADTGRNRKQSINIFDHIKNKNQ